MADGKAGMCRGKLKTAKIKADTAIDKLSQAKDAVALLNGALKDVFEARGLAAESPDARAEAAEFASKEGVLNSFKTAFSMLDRIRVNASEFDISRNEAVSFLETFRDYRKYTFHGMKELAEFISGVFSGEKSGKLVLRPTVSGILDISMIMRKFGATSKQDEFSLFSNRAGELISELYSNGITREYEISCNDVRVVFTEKNSVIVKAPHTRIPEYDRLCIKGGCTYSSD